MARLWGYTRNDLNGAGPLPVVRGPEPPPVVIGPPPDLGERYAESPVRPAADLLVRVGLWGAVLLACVAGVAGFVRSGRAGEVPELPPVAGETVPGPVTRVAEQAVEAWLTATTADDDEDARLGELFVERPQVGADAGGGLRVGEVTAVAGRRLYDGFWSVDVAAEVIEGGPADEDGEAGGGDEGGAGDGATDEEEEEEEAEVATTWYVQVGIVGDVGGRLAALTTPAVLPVPPTGAGGGWSPSRPELSVPAAGDPLAATVEGFLRALLAGGGDPSRYLAAGLSVAPQDPAPFTALVLEGLGAEELETGALHVYAEVRVTTPGGSTRVVAYELVASSRVDRWEVTQVTGALTALPPAAPPTTTDAPADEDEDEDDVEEEPSDTSVTSEGPGTTAPDEPRTTTTFASSPGA